jgi:hypothetical protein
MPKSPVKPPRELLFHTYLGVEIYLFDATHGHRREGWNHHQDLYCLVQLDPALPHKDFGLVGDDLNTLLLETKHVIDRRKKVKLN